MAVVSGVAAGAVASFGAFLPSVCADHGWSRALVSGGFTMLMVVMNLSSPLGGLLAQKYGPRRVVALGNLANAAGFLLLAFHSTVWQFYAAYGLLIGLGAGLGGMVPAATVANNWFRKKIALAMGISMSSVGLGGAVMIPIVMAVINHIGWRSAYLVLCGIMILVGAVLPALILINKPEDLGQTPDGITSDEPSAEGPLQPGAPDFTLKEAVGTPAFWLLVVSLAMVLFIYNTLVAHEVAFLQDIGISPAVAATALAMLMVFCTLGNIMTGVLSLRFTVRKLAVAAMVLEFCGAVLILLTRSLPTVFAYTVIFGFGYGATLVTIMSLLSLYYGRAHYPAIMGCLMLFGAVGTVGPPVAGAIYDATRSYRAAFTIGLVAAAVALVCMLLVRAPARRAAKREAAPGLAP